MEAEPPRMGPVSPSNRIAQLLGDGQVVFGVFSGDKTAEQGVKVARNREADFVFYCLETEPFDLPAMQAYMEAMASSEGGPHPIVLRIPPVRDDPQRAVERVGLGLGIGVDGIVFPHTENGEQAELAVQAMGDDVWPRRPTGRRITVLLIEDRAGVQNASQIVRTPGVSVVILGPGDLYKSYGGDAPAIEAAIQSVLVICKEQGVPCGITAGAADVGERVAQGFRMIIATEHAALVVGRRSVRSGRFPAS